MLARLAYGQAPTATTPRSESELVAAALASAQPAERPAPLVYANRDIVEFRANVFSRTPAERAAGAALFLDRLVNEGAVGQVTTDTLSEAVVVRVSGRTVFALVPADANTLAGETLDRKAADAASRLQLALDEMAELRKPTLLLRNSLLALGVSLVYVGALWLLRRIHLAGRARVRRTTEQQLNKLGGGGVAIREVGAQEYLIRTVTLVSMLLGLFVTYAWLTFVLRRFPYTRPWGESLRSGMISTTLLVGRRIVDALPNLFTILLIILLTRFLVRLTRRLFKAVEDGRISVPWLYAETAHSTGRIVAALLWLFALIVSYPYLPGSNSDVFKGVSVFVGLIISLGSSGIMNQVMSGLTITYSRALRLGDFVRIGDVEGTVHHLGPLSTKILTPRHEEITFPNAIVVSHATTNYSRHADSEGVFVPTSVTIGYDVPWRQVHALLLLAAERTAGIRPDPKPLVRQTALQDFYVEYTLLVTLEEPHLRSPVLGALHANILDAFNEFDVQIMSPHYERDPSGQKVVAKERWYAAPASSPSELSERRGDARKRGG